MIKNFKLKRINNFSDKLKLIDSKLNYKTINKKNNKIYLFLTLNLNFKNNYFFKFLIIFIFFYFLINFYKNNYLKDDYFNKYTYINEKLGNDYNSSIIIDNLLKNKKVNITLIDKESHTEIIKKKLFTFLNYNNIKFFNNYINICLKGILIDKHKYPLLKLPKISVIIPVYKGGKYLYYSLRSIQNQNMKEIEIILIDDCSPDDTIIKIKNYMKEDPRIRLIQNKINRKILYSKSIAALNSNGKYILQLDQDDLFIRNDAFDILYNEAENNNLDLTQIRDIFIKKPFLEKKTRINFIGRHFIFLRKSKDNYFFSHYKTQPEIKNKMFLNGCVFPLWGLLIRTDLYKKTIYYLWPIIMNYELIYYEDYLVTSFIVILSKRYKYLNNFALIHLNHKNSASNIFIKKFYISLLFFATILYNYYINIHPEDIQIAINLIQRYSYIYKPSYKIFPKLFQYNIINILNNQFLSSKNKGFILKVLKINPKKFKIWNSYKYLMNDSEYESILKYQKLTTLKPIINLNKKMRISIIIYCFEFIYLKKTIISILNQEFDKYEIIIVYDNNEYIYLNLIKNFLNIYPNIKIINNKKRKGILYSYSKGILLSQGDFILTLKSGETLANENILNNIYKIIINNYFDILEFNLLINNSKNININSFNLYKCKHFKKDINLDSFKYNKNYLEIYQQKDLLSNKLIKGTIYRNILKKYRFLEYKRNIYNYFDEIIEFLLFKDRPIFKRIDIYGVIQYINIINELYINNKINSKNQIIIDSIYYINFLFETSSNTFTEKKFVLDEFYNKLSIIYNKFNKINIESINLYKKFLNCKYITNLDKINLKFYINSLIN